MNLSKDFETLEHYANDALEVCCLLTPMEDMKLQLSRPIVKVPLTEAALQKLESVCTLTDVFTCGLEYTHPNGTIIQMWVPYMEDAAEELYEERKRAFKRQQLLAELKELEEE